MGMYMCSCGRDHPDEVVRAMGCPFEGRPPSPRQVAKEAAAKAAESGTALAERHRERAHEVWKVLQPAQEAGKREQQEHERAKLKAWLGDVKTKERAQVEAQNQADVVKVHELRDGLRAAEEHETRDRVRQMMAKL
jgi:hypothetical protein